MLSNLSLLIGSERITGWKSVEVKRSITQMSATFAVSMTDVWGTEPPSLYPELSVKILSGDDVIINGYIDDMSINTKADSYDVSVNGRCKTADLVDCSALNKPGTWKNIDVLRIAKDLCKPFNIDVESEVSLGEKIKELSITTGETVLDILTKVCKERAILPLGNNEGKLVLTIAGNNDAIDNLVYGGNSGNIISAEGRFNYKNRFSLYQVKGQTKSDGSGWGNVTTNIFGQATDEAVSRYRPKLFTADGLSSNNGATKRAKWEAQVRAGRSNALTVTIPGWRQSDGSLWKENLNVYTYIPPLRISAEMIIEEITYLLSEAGKLSIIKLVPPNTYSSEPKKAVKKKTRTESYGWF